MKTRNKLHGLLGLLLALAMLAVCVVPAFAATTDQNGVSFEKSITDDGNVSDSYTLKLNVKGKDKVTTTSDTTTTTSNGNADVVMVIDVTSSMSTTMSDGSTRLAAVQTAAKQFVDGLANGADSHISLVTFGMTSNAGNTPVWVNQDWTSVSDASKATLKNTIDGLTLHNDNYSYDTTYAPGLNKANEQLSASAVSNDGNNKYVIFFSDGDASDEQATITAAANPVKAKATVFSIGLPATQWYESTDKIESVASDSSKYFEASNSSAMVEAFNKALQTITEETKTSTTKTPMTNVLIEDTLSDYVDLDGTEVSVTSDDATEVVGFTVDEASNNKVKVTIKELKDGNTYTLQFNVKPSEKAKAEANAASAADVTKFDANKGATLSYNYGSETVNGTYAEKPQIAVAKEKVYTVTFVNAENQQTLSTQQVKNGETATKPADPTLDGYTFKGWYATENETYNFANPVVNDTMVYAQFDKNAGPVNTVSTVPVTKVLTVDGTTVVPNAEFSFTVTPLNGAPAIASAKTASSNAQTLKDGKVSLTTQLDLSKVNWPAAGDYEYTIKEDKTGYTNKAGRDEMSYDENTYTLRVRVVDNEGTLVPTIALYVDNSKVSDSDDGKVDEIVFNNTFKHTDPVKETLTIKKTVSGGDADSNRKFHFTVTFDKVLNTDGTDVNVGEVTEEFDLSASDDPVSFSVPEGTKYTVMETGTENWTGSVSVNGGTSVVAGKGEAVSTGEVTVDPAAEDQVVFLNTYNKPESPLTGFVKKNAAVLLAGILAVAVFAAYVFDRKRKAERKAARE